MNMEQKNKYIEQYIYDLAQQLNDKYDGFIDNDKIYRAIERFKNSTSDLETEIIPKINELVQENITNFIKSKYYKQYILIKRVADSIGNITEDEMIKLMLDNYDMIKNDDSEEITNLVILEFNSKRKKVLMLTMMFQV